jgi:hypothetical protein
MLPEGLLNPIGVTVPVNLPGSTWVAPANGSAPAAGLDGVVVVDGGCDVDDAGGVEGVVAVVRPVPASDPELTGIGGIGVAVEPRSGMARVLPAVSAVELPDPEPEGGLWVAAAEVPAGEVPATALPPIVVEQPTTSRAAPRPMRGSRR